MNVETLFSVSPVDVWGSRLDELVAAPRRPPFDPAAVRLVSSLSKAILADPGIRQFPDLAALAHWFRPANLRAMQQAVLEAAGDQRLRPRGLVFILAPANVDVLFLYGWLLSLLAGNATVVRLSQKPSAVRDYVLGILRDLAARTDAPEALADSWLISYPHDDRVTAKLSAVCDGRLIWGGDATVSKVRSIAMKPTAVEGGFADRFSIAAIRALSIIELDDQQLAELTRRFANDTLWSDQQACSSPRCVYWVGRDAEIGVARARFWAAYAAAAQRFEDSPAAVMSRVGDLFTLAARGAIDQIDGSPSARPALGLAQSPLASARDLHSGFGLFVEYSAQELAQLAQSLHDKDQTLVVHGFEPDDVEALVERLPNRSLDRIVQVGQATDFDVVWDGSNLFDLLLRRVSVARLSARA